MSLPKVSLLLISQLMDIDARLFSASGAATTAAKLGQPDLAIATLPDFVQNAAMISGLSYSTPLIADADTGFGGPAMVARTVQMYDRAGVAALHIEDQVRPSRTYFLRLG